MQGVLNFFVPVNICNLRESDAFSGQATLPNSFLPPFSIGVSSQRKEFAPLGANSFLKRRPHFGKVLLPREANRKSQKLFPFVKMAKIWSCTHIT